MTKFDLWPMRLHLSKRPLFFLLSCLIWFSLDGAFADKDGLSANGFCTSRESQLGTYLRRFGKSRKIANDIQGHWRRGKKGSGVHFMVIKDRYYLAADGPLGKDVSPLQVCYKKGDNSFTIHTSYKMIRQSLNVTFKGGSSFEVRNHGQLAGTYSRLSRGTLQAQAEYSKQISRNVK